MTYKIISLCILIITNIQVYNMEIIRTTLLDRFEICFIPTSSPFNLSQVTLKTTNHNTTINFDFDLSRELKTYQVIASITRCANRELLDSCIFFARVPVSDSCPILKIKDTIISSVTFASSPPLTCPLRKGHYIIQNATLDPNMVQFFPLENWYWKITLELRDKNQILLRICIEGKVVRKNFT